MTDRAYGHQASPRRPPDSFDMYEALCQRSGLVCGLAWSRLHHAGGTRSASQLPCPPSRYCGLMTRHTVNCLTTMALEMSSKGSADAVSDLQNRLVSSRQARGGHQLLLKPPTVPAGLAWPRVKRPWAPR